MSFTLGWGVHYFGPKTQNINMSYHLNRVEKIQVKNANTKEDNNNGAEQPLTIEVRLEGRPEKSSSYQSPREKKQEIWVGTIFHAPAIGSLSYGGFTKVGLSIVR